MNQLTLGSLFDGIGGFPLAGAKAGIRPVWASEIEPFPVRVTVKRFPGMKRYGDVNKLNGGELEPVDIITFGSPCQDLSVAGKRIGLDGSRSGLFREAIRIIKEMRCKTNGFYPRWAVWENVPGALSSANGYDFREVLETLIRIKDPEANVPMPEKSKWLSAGEIMGDDYSLAWRTLDASKGWGVAQRRKRIFAVIDLDGQRAGKVLFESEGLSGYSPPCGEARKGIARDFAIGPGETGLCLNDQGGSRMDITREMTSTLRAEAHHPPCIISASGFCTEHSANSRSVGYRQEESPTLRAGVTPGVAIEYTPAAICIKNGEDDLDQSLCSWAATNKSHDPHVFGISADQSKGMLSDNPHSGIYEAKTSRTLDCNGSSPACNQGGIMVVESMGASPPNAADKEDLPRSLDEEPSVAASSSEEYLVRRLTPDECCRLQGYPDGWCSNLGAEYPTDEEIALWSEIFQEWDAVNGKPDKKRSKKAIAKWLKNPGSDAAEYKAYGNSVAVPCVFFVLAGIVWVCGESVSHD